MSTSGEAEVTRTGDNERVEDSIASTLLVSNNRSEVPEPRLRKRSLELVEGLEFLPTDYCSSVRCGSCQGFAKYICRRCHRRYYCGYSCLYKNGRKCNRGWCTSKPMKICGTCGYSSYDVFSCPICHVSICSRECFESNWHWHKIAHERAMEKVD